MLREAKEKPFVRLKRLLRNKKLPTEPFRFNECSIIYDAQRFIDSHITILESNPGNATFRPYYDRLVQLNKLLNGTGNPIIKD